MFSAAQIWRWYHIICFVLRAARVSLSVTACAASTSTTDALDCVFFLELFLRDATDASAVEIGLLGLDAAETA